MTSKLPMWTGISQLSLYDAVVTDLQWPSRRLLVSKLK